jgi:hypothetical protein
MDQPDKYPMITDPRIVVTVHRAENTTTLTLSARNEFNRIHRLVRTVSRIPDYVLPHIAELGDCAGWLGVEWRELPDGDFITEVRSAWAQEGESVVNHFFAGRSLLANGCNDLPSQCGGANLWEEPRGAANVMPLRPKSKETPAS